MTNPFAPAPEGTTADDPFVSGGGGDGTIDIVVAECLLRVNEGYIAPDIDAGPFDARECDLAELISWGCGVAGVEPLPPARDDLFWVYCRTWGQSMTVAQGMTTKGAVLFAGSTPGLSLGMRNRVIIYDQTIGPTVTDAAVHGWTVATTIPRARGYR